MNYIEIGYGFIFVIILDQLTDFILGACNFFCHDENYCDDDYKRSDGVRWVERKISQHHLRFPFLLQPAKVHGRPSVPLKMILK